MIQRLDQTNKIDKSEYIILNIDIIPISSDPIFSGFIHIKDGLIYDFGKNLDQSFLSEPYKIPIYDGSSYKLIPSFINSHTHSAMSFFRGLGCFLTPNTSKNSSMIENFLFPAEKSLTKEDVEIFSYSYLIDGIKTGTSCFCDHYYFIEGVANTMETLGVKGVIGETLCDLGGSFITTQDDWTKIKDSIRNWKYSSRIEPILSPHASDTVSSSFLKQIVDFSRSENLGIHMHLSQTQGERQRTLKKDSLSPVEFLAKCGGLNSKTLLVHMLSADKNDLAMVKDSEATICLCPSSEMIYESAPTELLLDSGINTVLGTDCAASQDSANIFNELKTLSLLSKRYPSSDYLDASCVLKTVTTVPANFFNLNCGSIEVGKSADLTYIKKDISTTLDFEKNIESNLIFSSNDKFVEHLSVEGRFILWNKQITTISEKSVMDEYQSRFKRIAKHCGFMEIK